MANGKRTTWGQSEFYEVLCLLVTGALWWNIGVQFEVFAAFNRFVLAHGFSDLFTFAVVMGVAVACASVHKSFRLRRVMRERDAAAQQAEAIARHDPLTGLANRRLLLEAIDTQRRDATEPSGAVLLIDLDRFKPVNDLYGHAAGDAVLCAVADRLHALKPVQGLAARLGGDEFALLVNLDGGADGLMRLAQQVIASISRPVLWNRTEMKVGATVGIAMVSATEGDALAIMHAADLAMYQGKKDGRGTYRFFQTAMDVELEDSAQLEREIRTAIDTGEIKPFYQPIVALPGQDIVGVEVLARWWHPTRGLLTPDKFIPVAEETGMVADLCYRLLRQACLDAKAWPAHLRVAVNISPQQFQDRWLAERILSILTETGFPPNRLEVEITETALVQDLEATRSILTSLQNLGVRIALDDFGTGYSSLYHLRELQFDKLKIDRSYVDSITMSEERAKLVDAIIKLGASLGLMTTAEGIETSASVDWLTGQGCDFGQGYLFGAPMPKDAMDRLIMAQPDQQRPCLSAEEAA